MLQRCLTLTSALVDGLAAAAIGLPTSGARAVAGGLARGERRVADRPAPVERPPPRVRCLFHALHEAACVVLDAPQRVQRRRRHGLSTSRQVRGSGGAAGAERLGGKEGEDEQDDESSLPLHYCVVASVLLASAAVHMRQGVLGAVLYRWDLEGAVVAVECDSNSTPNDTREARRRACCALLLND